jgi:hypothetical protein
MWSARIATLRAIEVPVRSGPGAATIALCVLVTAPGAGRGGVANTPGHDGDSASGSDCKPPDRKVGLGGTVSMV